MHRLCSLLMQRRDKDGAGARWAQLDTPGGVPSVQNIFTVMSGSRIKFYASKFLVMLPRGQRSTYSPRLQDKRLPDLNQLPSADVRRANRVER